MLDNSPRVSAGHRVFAPTIAPMSLVIFSHANSFPASCYGVMFKSLRARGVAVDVRGRKLEDRTEHRLIGPALVGMAPLLAEGSGVRDGGKKQGQRQEDHNSSTQ